MDTEHCTKWIRLTFHNFMQEGKVFLSGVIRFVDATHCSPSPCLLVLRDSLPYSRNLCLVAYREEGFDSASVETKAAASFGHSSIELVPCSTTLRAIVEEIRESRPIHWDLFNPVICTGPAFSVLYSGADFGLSIARPFITQPIPSLPYRYRQPVSIKNGGHLVFGVKDPADLTQILMGKGGMVLDSVDYVPSPTIKFGIYVAQRQSPIFVRQLKSCIDRFKAANKPLLVIVPSASHPRNSLLYAALRREGCDFDVCSQRVRHSEHPSSSTHPDTAGSSTGSTTPPLTVSTTVNLPPDGPTSK